MQKDALKKSLNKRVRLRPIARRFNGGRHGAELPLVDDYWVIEQVTAEGVTLRNTRTGHRPSLRFDHIHHFTSDLADGYGFLVLTVQLHIGGIDAWIEPLPLREPSTLRP